MRRFLGFSLVGAVSTLLSYALYLFLNLFISYHMSYLFSYIFGLVCSFILNSKLVFRIDLSIRKFLLYPSVYVLQYAISASILYFLVDFLNFEASVAPIFISFLTLPLTYMTSKILLENKSHSSS
ncbi:GtrA family protein [Vibrio cholerae]|uniref:GtrA family protein n=1 Tax=Vibrio cholerae TaxID=666 RepID=UPI000BA96BE6|nr:GtrA family protein [Vibrio cholerae]PAS04611.1 polysaccharide synthesis protein GtrA [Vibrio cholerae]BCN19213.1 hypothetical protein [Vibrio cholerae]BCN19959.1 hypothetical protein [Vibrio cholerae]HCJ7266129.1 GtrA family protein [Vibrio cholerae]